MISNGNIQFHEDVQKCLDETGADGVMSAEGLLYNPSLFSAKHEPCWKIAREYFDLFKEHHDLNVSRSCLRAHLFKILHHVLQVEGNEQLRDDLSAAKSYEEFSAIIDKIKDLYQVDNEDQTLGTSTIPIPIYLCQPYFRPRNSVVKVDGEGGNQEVERIKRMADDTIKVCGTVSKVSKKQAKKLMKLEAKKERKENKRMLMEFESCANCPNTRGLKCIHSMCKLCCAIELKRDSNSSCLGMYPAIKCVPNDIFQATRKHKKDHKPEAKLRWLSDWNILL